MYYYMSDLPKILGGEPFAELCCRVAPGHDITKSGLAFRDPPKDDPAPAAADVAAVIQWALLGREGAAIERPQSSYGAKHDAENWHQALSGHRYIPNGAAIVALAIMMPNWKPRWSDGPNCVWTRIRDPEATYFRICDVLERQAA